MTIDEYFFPNTWRCPVCGEANAAHNEECVECGYGWEEIED